MPHKMYAAARGSMKSETLPPHWDDLPSIFQEVVKEIINQVASVVGEMHEARHQAAAKSNQTFIDALINGVGLPEGSYTVAQIIIAARNMTGAEQAMLPKDPNNPDPNDPNMFPNGVDPALQPVLPGLDLNAQAHARAEAEAMRRKLETENGPVIEGEVLVQGTTVIPAAA